jgi:predicted enzyme related to lactoylglutathione lyase
MESPVSAVLFAKDHAKVASFYRDAFDARTLSGNADHTVLEFRGFQLMIHQIPRHLAKDIAMPNPVQRREQASLRLDLPTRNLERSRTVAKLLFGTIDDTPPPWAAPDARFHLGHDPEGNVFGVVSVEAP